MSPHHRHDESMGRYGITSRAVNGRVLWLQPEFIEFLDNDDISTDEYDAGGQ